MGIDKATIHRIGRQTIRGENTPDGDNTLIVPRRNVHAPAQEWAYNTTGYELKAGYIVEVTDFDPTTNKYTIRRPSADGLPNIAVVKSSVTPSGSGNRVELQFTGTALLWYGSTAPTVADTVGSKKDSFEVLVGASGFAPLETGATVGGSGRCRARFFNAGGGEIHYAEFTGTQYHFEDFDGDSFYNDIETQYIEFKKPVFLSNSMAWLVYGEGINYGRLSIVGDGTKYSWITNMRLVMYNAAEDEIGSFTQIDNPTAPEWQAYAAQYAYANTCSSTYIFQLPLRGEFHPASGITDFTATKAKIKFFLNANCSYEIQVEAKWFVFFNFNRY